MPTSLRLAALAATLALAASCSCGEPKVACNATNCAGCCDSTGQCQPGALPSACGQGGTGCNVCLGSQQCRVGFCVATPQDDGGTADGGACPSGEQRCGPACVDIRVDPGNCGMCIRPCGQDQACSNSQCVTTGDCRTNGPCPAGNYCESSTGRCRPGCGSTA